MARRPTAGVALGRKKLVDSDDDDDEEEFDFGYKKNETKKVDSK
jgi:hypothetical protein